MVNTKVSIKNNVLVYGAFMHINDVDTAAEYLCDAMAASEIENDGWADETITTAAVTNDLVEVRTTAREAFAGEIIDLLKAGE